jgi:hypothetical protein
MCFALCPLPHALPTFPFFPSFNPFLFPHIIDPFNILTTGPCLWHHKDKKIREGNMLIQTKIQIDPKDYEFVKKVYKDLHYKSLSEYMRKAITAKVKQDRKRLREQKRIAAMEMIGKAPYENLFESIEGEDFESR